MKNSCAILAIFLRQTGRNHVRIANGLDFVDVVVFDSRVKQLVDRVEKAHNLINRDRDALTDRYKIKKKLHSIKNKSLQCKPRGAYSRLQSR